LQESEPTNEVPLQASGNSLHIQQELNTVANPEYSFHPDDVEG